MIIQLLNIVGVAVFAASGVLAAGRKNLDLLGVAVMAFVTAVGGGTVRDVLLQRYPIFWVQDPIYLVVILCAAGATMLYAQFLEPPRVSLKVADALGLALFSISGARLAESDGLPPLTIIFMGTVTGSVGGVIRDVLSGQVPLLFRKGDLYATAAIAGVAVYLVAQWIGLRAEPASYMAMAAVAALRFAAIRWRIQLPEFRVRDQNANEN
jgi:uncharacterized membrane protein YeiH